MWNSANNIPDDLSEGDKAHSTEYDTRVEETLARPWVSHYPTVVWMLEKLADGLKEDVEDGRSQPVKRYGVIPQWPPDIHSTRLLRRA
jgi:hypothetical protein